MDLERLIEDYIIDINDNKTGVLLRKLESVWSSDKKLALDDGIKFLISNNMNLIVNPLSRNEELLTTYIVNSGLSEDNIIVS
jgi:hypothetical protein